jgi:hypothetical protein
MSFWDIIDFILDWFFNWRANICFWTSVFLAVLALTSIPYHPLGVIAAVVIIVAGLVTGIYVNRSN